MRAVKNPDFNLLNNDYDTKHFDIIKSKYFSLYPRIEIVEFELSNHIIHLMNNSIHLT